MLRTRPGPFGPERWRRRTSFFSSRRRHTRSFGDWSSDVCSSDLALQTDLFGYPCDVAGLFAQMVVEIERIEVLARLTQGQIQRQEKLLRLAVDAQGDLLALRFGRLNLRLGRALPD